jgi:hypothetical protein
MKTIAERLLALPSCEDPDEILNAAITGAHEIQRLTAREYLRRKADQRAIEAWHKAHPEKAHMPPNHEDTVMWLMEQHDQFETRLKNAHHDWLAELNHDTDQLMEEARLGGLEEGARWHDEQAAEAQKLSDMKVSALDSKVWGDYAQNHREYATAMRALKGEGNE